MSDKKKSVLGRGLGALLESNDTSDRARDTKTSSTLGQTGVIINIPLEQIEVNPFQPRSTFEEESLKELLQELHE